MTKGILKVNVTANTRGPTHPCVTKSELITSASWNTAGRVMNTTRTLGSTREAEEIGVPNWSGGCNSGADVESMDMEGGGDTEKDQVIMVEARVMETVAPSAETDSTKDTIAGMWVHAGSKGIY